MFLNKLESTLQYWSAISVCAASSIIVEIVSYKSGPIEHVASQTIPERGSSFRLYYESFFDSAEEISQSEKILTIFFLYNSTQTISVLLDLTLKAQSFFFFK